MRDFSLGMLAVICACGGGGSGTTRTNTTPTASATTSAAPSASAAANDEKYEDPNESAEAVTMAPLVTKTTPKASFPKAKTGDGECWKTVSFSGQHDKDWQPLIDKCGSPTGLLEFVKPATGRLHHIKDAVDSFTAPMQKGMCYRVFAVADSSIHDIDIVILRNCAILGT